jgi:lipopolysaccharide export system protein LptA
VHINRGDSIHLYSDTLYYYGNQKLARMRSNVVVHNDSLELRTPELHYYMQHDLAEYNKGGVTVNRDDTLRSRVGKYYAKKDLFHFSHNVEVINNRFRILCDTLKHDTYQQISFFLGPTEIIGDSNYIYCENGWYNHKFDKAQFRENAYFTTKAYKLQGDSLIYDRRHGLGNAYQNISLHDTAQHVSIYGHYAEYREANERALVCDSALLVQFDAKGDSLFLHADTLMNIKELAPTDSLPKQIVRAYGGVRTYRADMQMICDSLVYQYQDSIIELHQQPIVWSEQHQLTAQRIDLFLKNRAPDYAKFYETSLFVSRENDWYYNQVAGVDMTAFFQAKELREIEVHKSGTIIFFLKDGEKFTGVNKSESERIKFYLKDREPDGVLFPQKSTGAIYPMKYLKSEELFLPNFKWFSELRPLHKNDVFR